MKTQTAKHTPTPWSFNAENDCIQSDHEDYQFSIIAKIATGEDRMETTNGLFICKAVNEHDTLIAQRDALLEACKIALERLTDERLGEASYMCGSEIYDDFDKAIILLRAAIALCEPKEV